jgi:hypothetical protein
MAWAMPPVWLDELRSRREDRRTRTMVKLTWAIAAMTLANLVLVACTVID